MNVGKRFDIILINPPYGIKGNAIANRFLNKVTDLSNIIISIQPSSFITKFKSDKKHKSSDEEKSLENFNKYYTEINIFDKSEFNAAIQQELSIIYINKNKKQSIIVSNKFGTSSYNESHKINKYNNNKLIEEFLNIINPLYKKDNINNHITYTDPRDKKSIEIKNNDEKEKKYYVNISYIRGNIGTDDMITFIPRNIKPEQTNRGRTYINFDNKNECQNFINYLNTDFARMCLWYIKNDTALAYNTRLTPWFDFSDEHFSKSPRKIDDWLFKKYNIDDKIRKHIEEILPDYYNIRNKYNDVK